MDTVDGKTVDSTNKTVSDISGSLTESYDVSDRSSDVSTNSDVTYICDDGRSDVTDGREDEINPRNTNGKETSRISYRAESENDVTAKSDDADGSNDNVSGITDDVSSTTDDITVITEDVPVTTADDVNDGSVACISDVTQDSVSMADNNGTLSGYIFKTIMCLYSQY